MNVLHAIENFSNLSTREKTNFLIRFVHSLTILARDAYEVEGDALANPSRLRLINEVQHRVTSSLVALTNEDANQYPDDVLVKIILEHPEDIDLQRQLEDAFARLMPQVSVAT